MTKKLGKMTEVAQKSTYNLKTKRYFGFPDNYVPDPIHYRKSIWFDAGVYLELVGRHSQGGTGSQAGRPSRRARDVSRARLEHDACVALHRYGASLQNEEQRYRSTARRRSRR